MTTPSSWEIGARGIARPLLALASHARPPAVPPAGDGRNRDSAAGWIADPRCPVTRQLRLHGISRSSYSESATARAVRMATGFEPVSDKAALLTVPSAPQASGTTRAPPASLSILYLGDDVEGSTSLDRALALQRVGHRVRLINPERLLRQGPLSARVNRTTGYALSRGVVHRGLVRRVDGSAYDLAWVGGGRQIGADLVRILRRSCGRVVNYNNDDPFGGRDHRLWRTYLEAVPDYDLVVVVREANISEAYERGARCVHRVWMSYDPVAHRPRPITREVSEKWESDVLFVGTWMPERGPFLARLVERGVPLTLYGPRWEKAPEWPVLRSAWRGPFLRGDAQAYAIQTAKVCLGLLSKGNRDLHTQRSLEIPALGGLLCAERTSEHQQLYIEDREAVYWSSADECAAKCLRLLGAATERERIAQAGHMKVHQLRLTNDDVVQQIVARVYE
jgi:spore maturation protein CgeB